MHYKAIVIALMETVRLMAELSALSDNPDEELARRAKIVLLLGEGR